MIYLKSLGLTVATILGLSGCVSTPSLTSDCVSPILEQGFSGLSDSISPASKSDNESAPYKWRSVAIGGMGFVTGISIHPTEPDIVYARTDSGGVFRWNAQASHWIPLMDQFSRNDEHYYGYGVESIALDPNNPDVVYAAVGAYTSKPNSGVLKSTDRGQTWMPTGLKTPDGTNVRMGGNEDWRWAGERLAVDPNNSNIIYFGSRLDGLYQSDNGAKSWQKVTSFPETDLTQGGITFVVFAPQSDQAPSSSQTIYVGAMGKGVYQSTDAGQTWHLISTTIEAIHHPQRAAVAADGTLYATTFAASELSPGGVWKYANQQWINITPKENKSFNGITVDPLQSDVVMASEYPLKPSGLYRSTNGGTTWNNIKIRTSVPSWWPNWHLYTLMGGLAIDPHRPQRVWLTTGFGVFQTDDITANPSRWSACMGNLEELVTFVVKSPPLPNGAPLISGVADMHGFRHESLTQFPKQTFEKSAFGDTTGIDFSVADPNIIVRVGSVQEGDRENGQVRSAYSSDNGRTWIPFRNTPTGAINGKVAVSATLQPNGKPIIVWAPQGDSYPHRSLDGGASWSPVYGAPNRTTLQVWFSSQAIASDRVDGDLFYMYKYESGGAFYRSMDGGATWTETISGLSENYRHTVKAVPGMRGEVWLNIRDSGLYRSSDAGLTLTEIAGIQNVRKFTFGKAAPGEVHPTVFAYGTIAGEEGLFRSDDLLGTSGNGADATWVKISTDRHALSNVSYLEGDLLRFGRVYVGTGGRGIFYGEPIDVEALEAFTRSSP